MTRARSLSLLANANAFTVSGSNNVGIGSTLPDGKLDVDGDILVGTAITIGKVSGIISATSYRGDGSQLTGVDSSNLIDSGDTNRVAANTSGIVVTGIATVTGNMNVGGVLTYDDVTNVDSLGIITARSHVSIADSILHTGDTDTSIRFPSANTFTVETGGTEAFRVDSDQRLLIGGTTNEYTAANLQVANTSSSTLFLYNSDTSATGEAVLALGPSNKITGSQLKCIATEDFSVSANRTADLAIETRLDGDLAERLRITSEGHIKHTGLRNGNSENKLAHYTVPSHDTGEEDVVVFTVANESSSNQITFGGGPSAYNAATEFIFRTAASVDTTVGTERLKITNGGLIGVNVTPTQQKLTIDLNNSGTTAASYDGINICNTDSTTNNGAAIVFGQAVAGNSYARIGVIHSDRSSGSEDQDIFFGTLGGGSYAERVRITSTGRLLVGTTSSVDSSNENVAIVSGGNTQLTLARNDTSVGDGHTLAQIKVFGNDSNGTYQECARIGFEADDNHATDDKPTRMVFETTTAGASSPTERLRISHDGHVLPGADDTYDLGSTGRRWANIYSADLQLSNEGSSNDVDGTWGQYTIQEGENDLFLLNRRNGKKYKFMLQEVD